MVGVFYIILACLLWAIDTLIRYPLISSGVSSLAVVYYCHLILSAMFIPYIVKSLPKMGNTKLSDVFSFLVVGVFGSALATLSFTEAFKYLNPSLVILFQKFQPLVVIFLARFVLGEKWKTEFLFWGMLALIGALLISFEDIGTLIRSEEELYQLLFHQGAGRGYLYVLISILGWGSSTVFGKKLANRGFDEKQIMAGRFLIGLIALLPFVIQSNTELVYAPIVYGKFLAMALISGVISLYFYYKGLKSISAKTCTLAEMSFPFWAIIVNWLILQQKLSVIQLIGGGMLILSSLIIQLRRL